MVQNAADTLRIVADFVFPNQPRLEAAPLPSLQRVRRVRPENPIPHHEERLREVALTACELVMDVVVCRVVAEHGVERIPRQHEAAVIVDPLDGGHREEEGRSSGRHARDEVCHCPRQGLGDDPVHRVVVLRGERVRRHHAVVPGVELAVQLPVGVHVPVDEVLPRIEDEHRDEELLCEYEKRMQRACGGGRSSSDLSAIAC